MPEYMAMPFASRHLISLLRGLQQLRQHTSYGVATDSQGALELAKNHRINNRSKHLDTHYHFVREQLEAGTFDLLCTDR